MTAAGLTGCLSGHRQVSEIEHVAEEARPGA